MVCHPLPPPTAVLWQARVMPVVSDFDTFLVGSRGMRYDATPPEQLKLVHWALDHTAKVHLTSYILHLTLGARTYSQGRSYILHITSYTGRSTIRPRYILHLTSYTLHWALYHTAKVHLTSYILHWALYHTAKMRRIELGTFATHAAAELLLLWIPPDL